MAFERSSAAALPPARMRKLAKNALRRYHAKSDSPAAGAEYTAAKRAA